MDTGTLMLLWLFRQEEDYLCICPSCSSSFRCLKCYPCSYLCPCLCLYHRWVWILLFDWSNVKYWWVPIIWNWLSILHWVHFRGLRVMPLLLLHLMYEYGTRYGTAGWTIGRYVQNPGASLDGTRQNLDHLLEQVGTLGGVAVGKPEWDMF